MTADRVHVSVWTPDLSEQLAVVPKRRNLTWQDPLNSAGMGSLEVRADAPAAPYLRDRNIVRLWWAGDYRYAFRIQKPKLTVVDTDSGTTRRLTVAGPGVTDMLNDAVLYPEGGLARRALDQRAFTFASAVGDWYVGSEWTAPQGVGWLVDTTARNGDPADWPDHSAQWIWDTNPDTTDTGGKVVYFRGEFTLTDTTQLRIDATADNFFELYLDGQQILASDYEDPLTWRRTSTYTGFLEAGTHLLAARVTNEFPHGTYANPAAFLCSVATVDSKGAPVTVLLRSNTTDWLCRPEGGTPPAWRAAQILHTFITEAQFRGVTAVNAVTMDFTPELDSAGSAWTDNVDRSFNVGTKGADLVEQLCEQGIDIAVGPDLVVHAWTRRGVDRSTGANPVVLRPARNLTGYTIDDDLAITTRLLVRTPTGWLEVAADNEATDGRVEDLLLAGNASSDAQATRQAHASFDDVALSVATFEATCVPVAGATPYVDFDNGDTVLAPDGAGSAIALRVMSINFTEDDKGRVTFVPELYEA